MTINHYIPDEVLLEIFDSYREDIDPYDQWRKQHVWIYLTHVCRRWRAIIFASSSRLDLGITIGMKKPGHIKTILSGPLPIFIDFKYGLNDIVEFGSARWRMLAALRHHDRVREISFQGMSAKFDEFFEATKCTFPILESLSLSFRYDYQPIFPDTFLGGPDLSINLRRLKWEYPPLETISRILSSAKALTDLSLLFDSLSKSAENLLACLQGMPCLCNLDLTITHWHSFPLQSPTPKDIVTLSKLRCLHFHGHGACLDFFVSGLSAPSLRDVNFEYSEFYHDIWTVNKAIQHLPRFINEIKEHYHAVHVDCKRYHFFLSLLTHSEYVSQCKPRFNFGKVSKNYVHSVFQITRTLSTRLYTIEELRVTFDGTDASDWEFFPWRRFLLQFPRVKALRTEGKNNYCIGRALFPDLEGFDDDLDFLPTLEEIELGKDELRTHESQRRDQLTIFEPFVTARQQAGRTLGRTVKVFFDP